MVGRKRIRIQSSSGHNIEVLNVPWYHQAADEALCFIYSLWMCLQYCKNTAKTELSTLIDERSIDELAKFCRANPQSGTRVTLSLMNSLNRDLKPLVFQFKEGTRFIELEKQLSANLPSIILYDCGYLESGIVSEVGHAGVAIGLTEQTIILNNPWLGALVEVDRQVFQDAWEIEFKRAVLISLHYQRPLEL